MRWEGSTRDPKSPFLCWDGGRGGGGVAGEVACLRVKVTSSWDRRGHSRGRRGWWVGALEHFPQEDEALGTRGVTPAAGRAGLMDGC